LPSASCDARDRRCSSERPHTQGRTHSIPALANLFGTPRRVLLGMGQDVGEDGDWREPLRDVGRLLAYLKEPEPPRGWRDAWEKMPVLRKVLDMAPKVVSRAPCREVVWEGAELDLSRLPSSTAGRGMRVRSSPGGWWLPAGRTRSARTWGSTASK